MLGSARQLLRLLASLSLLVSLALVAPPALAQPETAQPPTPIVPTHLSIPSIGVDAPVEQVGLTADGAVANPSTWMTTAWYKLGYVPGTPGNAAIVGHLDSTTGPAVFWHLRDLQPGDQVQIDDGTTTLTFLVQGVASYPADQSPMVKVYGPAPVPHLNLITCSGDWDPVAHSYSNRLVVYTVLQGFQDAGPNCQFVLGFQSMHDQLADVVGDCLDDEGHAANGDALQHTTGGMLVWRKADNWTAFTDGFHTWVNGPNGIQERLDSQRFPWEANPDGLPVVS